MIAPEEKAHPSDVVMPPGGTGAALLRFLRAEVSARPCVSYVDTVLWSPLSWRGQGTCRGWSPRSEPWNVQITQSVMVTLSCREVPALVTLDQSRSLLS